MKGEKRTWAGMMVGTFNNYGVVENNWGSVDGTCAKLGSRLYTSESEERKRKIGRRMDGVGVSNDGNTREVHPLYMNGS